MSDNGFYRAFEDKHRGSREIIKKRLAVYLPFIIPLHQASDTIYPCIDLGCGRGEWLELLKENGFQANGVDTDEGMLAASIERSLNVSNQDALSVLRNAADNSQLVISGFHIAEHLEFEYLLSIVKEAMRVLIPGGLLILETPNPENLLVGAANFYIDPTHQRPIPPLLLEFIAEYVGFSRTKTLFLQESAELKNKQNIQLIDVLASTSPDYAIIAQKSADKFIYSRLDHVFSKEYGLTITALAQRFEEGNLAKLQVINTQVNTLENEISKVKHEIQEIYLSRSWRVTYPLRWIAHQLRILKERGLKSRVKALVKKPIFSLAKYAARIFDHHPEKRHQIIQLTKRIGLYRHFKKIYRKITHSHDMVANLTHYIPYAEDEYLSESALEVKKQLAEALGKK